MLPVFPIHNESVEIPLNLLVDTQESEKKSLSSSSPLWSAAGCHVFFNAWFVFIFWRRVDALDPFAFYRLVAKIRISFS